MKLIKHKTTRNKIKKVLKIILSLVLAFAVCLNLFLIINYDVLPIKYLIVFIIIFGIIPSLLIYLTNFKRQKKVRRIISITLEFIYIIILFVMFSYLNKTFDFVDNFTSGFNYETKNYYVLVNKDDNYDKITDLNNTTIGYVKNLDVSIEKDLDKLDKKIKTNHQEYEGITELLESLENKEIESILMIDSFYEMLEESEEDKISDKTKILYEFSIKEEIESIGKKVDVTKDTFNVYISGIDSDGDVTSKTRSDVNIVMNINPKTNKILMVNIPRDYYVELDGFGKRDKLTHAGMYGVNKSIKTIENLLDTKINYYVKVNYKALTELVDALGGVEVYSKYDFYSAEFSYPFKVGYNKVNGKKALDFVRTRKAFLDGDRVRGENQQAMIEAIIKKASNASILLKYNDILESLKGNFTTNISTNQIMELVNFQIDKMPKWNIESISLNGSDSYDLTYTYPTQELYVMVPNEETIEVAKLKLESNK